MNPPDVRHMRLSDVDAVCAIEQLCFTMPWQRISFVNEVENNRAARYFVAETDGEVVGYGGFWVVLDEGHITNIAVHPAHRRRGVGMAILENMMQYAANLGINWMTLEVRASNISAQLLYKRNGFIKVGRRPKYYGDEDAFLMVCEELPGADPDFADDAAIVRE